MKSIFKTNEKIPNPRINRHEDLLNEIEQQTPPESVRFIEQSLAMANHIEILLSDKGLKQKDLADKLGKSEAEISKWLSGTHNFTLRSIAKIEDVLNENIIEFPQRKVNTLLLPENRKAPFEVANKISRPRSKKLERV
jgi:transcriptional regulator with XRE-family HTH domain